MYEDIALQLITPICGFFPEIGGNGHRRIKDSDKDERGWTLIGGWLYGPPRTVIHNKVIQYG